MNSPVCVALVVLPQPSVAVHVLRIRSGEDIILFNGRGGEYEATIASVELVRRGRVRRAKLYYLRALSGKAARIREKRES